MHLFVEGYGFVICEAEGPSGSLGCPDLSSMSVCYWAYDY